MDTFIAIGLIVLAFLGAPLFAIFGAAGLILFTQSGESIIAVATPVFSASFSESPHLVTLPFFTFAGYLLAESGTPNRIVRLSQAFFGWLPGGLAMVCVVASAWFTVFTGGSGITIVAIGGLLLPALLKDGYSKNFSLGLITSGGSLGLIFPPSVPLVLYAVVAQLLIDKIFLAGIIPGALTVLLMMGFGAIVGWRNKPKEERGSAFMALVRLLAFVTIGWLVVAIYKLATDKEARSATWEAKWELLIPVVLLFALWAGSIAEAAALVALYCLVTQVLFYRDISFTRDVPRVIRESMTMLGAILAILVTAIGFTGYIIQAEVPQQMVEWISGITDSPIVFLLALNLFLLVVGMFMDIFTAIIVVVPLLTLPACNSLAHHFGIDDYHLAIIFLLNLEIGYLTPPVGLNLFISSFRFKEPVTRLYRAVVPFIAVLVVALLVTTYIPFLSTWLPSKVAAEDERCRDESAQGASPGMLLEPDDDDGGETLDELGGGGGLTLDDLDDLDDDAFEGATLDDLEATEGETLDDLDAPAPEDETLDDLDAPAPEGETLDDLE